MSSQFSLVNGQLQSNPQQWYSFTSTASLWIYSNVNINDSYACKKIPPVGISKDSSGYLYQQAYKMKLVI